MGFFFQYDSSNIIRYTIVPTTKQRLTLTLETEKVKSKNGVSESTLIYDVHCNGFALIK